MEIFPDSVVVLCVGKGVFPKWIPSVEVFTDSVVILFWRKGEFRKFIQIVVCRSHNKFGNGS